MLMQIRERRGWIRVVFWMLIVVFGAGFVIGGVGTGSRFSISDIFGSNGGSSSTPGNIKAALKTTTAHPKDASAWASLSGAYSAQNKTSDAITAMRRATKLDPRNTDYLITLSNLLQGQGAALSQEASSLYQQAAALQSSAQTQTPLGPASGPLSTALQSPLSQAQQGQVGAQASQLQGEGAAIGQQAQGWYRQALVPLTTLTRRTEGTANEAQSQLLLGQAAQNAQQTPVAVKAYRRFLKVAPSDPIAPQVRQALKSLTAKAHPSASGAGASGSTGK